jgi:hypothetical protein
MKSTSLDDTIPKNPPARWIVPPRWKFHVAGWGMALAIILAGAVPFLCEKYLARETTPTLAALTPAPIDGNRAYGYLKQICALGPRPAGSEANARQLRMVADHFKKHGATLQEQRFSGVDPLTRRRVEMVNLIASWDPEKKDRVLICAHYDTRPRPDQETTQEGYNQPFLGANDCASGVALLMEIAHHLTDLPTARGVDLVLLDGEELVYDQQGEYFLGSKAFARAYAAARRSNKIKYRYSAGILLDMVGGREMTLKREPYSVKLAPRLVEEVWSVAAKLGAKSFSREFGREVLDDHLALNDGGIPTIDVIDFDYPHWHLASDTPEQCTGASLAEVGRVVTAWLTLPSRK